MHAYMQSLKFYACLIYGTSRQATDGTVDLMMFSHVYDTLEPTSRLLEKGSLESLTA
jgi:hypothetical protein